MIRESLPGKYECSFICSVLSERTPIGVAMKCVEMIAACLRIIPELA
jgi:hypothetical protein